MPISLFLSLPQVAQSFVCITVDHYGKWALVAAAAVAGGNGDGCIFETDPPWYPKPHRKHPNATYYTVM